MHKHLAWFLVVILAAAIVMPAQPVSSPTEYRLQLFDVQHYELDMTVRNPYSKQVEGHVDIIVRWTEKAPSPSFPVNARGIRIDSVFSRQLALGRSVESGQVDTISIWYSGTMTTEGGGQGAWGGVWYEGQVLYALGVGFHNPNVSTTQHWMPCYDHPSDKATFRGTFRVPRDQYAASVDRLESVEIRNLLVPLCRRSVREDGIDPLRRPARGLFTSS